jgi:putative transposase
VSITLEAAFCVETLQDALIKHGKPEIFNTDRGSQFTGAAFTGVLTDNGIAISMDGKGAWRDNVSLGWSSSAWPTPAATRKDTK